MSSLKKEFSKETDCEAEKAFIRSKVVWKNTGGDGVKCGMRIVDMVYVRTMFQIVSEQSSCLSAYLA